MTYTNPFTFTCDKNDGTAPEVFSLTADALNAIEADRLEQVAMVGAANVPPDVLSVIQRDLNTRTVIPAIEAHKPAALQTAYDAYQAALAQTIGANTILPQG